MMNINTRVRGNEMSSPKYCCASLIGSIALLRGVEVDTAGDGLLVESAVSDAMYVENDAVLSPVALSENAVAVSDIKNVASA